MRSRRFVSRLLAAVVLAALPARRSFAWGDDVHELIVRLTVRILPEEVRRALGLNERAMAAAAAEPDRRAKRDAAEGPRQYIDIEMTDAAFLDAWREKLAAATAEAGVVPGVEALRKLRGAFVNDYFSKRKFPLPKAEAGRLFDALPPKAEAFMGKVGIEGAGWIGTGPYTVGLRYDELARAASRCDAA